MTAALTARGYIDLARYSCGRSHLLRKPVPNLRAPGAIGRAGCRWQYPDSGIGNQFDLLAVISLTAQKLLSRGLAGEGEKLRLAREDRCT